MKGLQDLLQQFNSSTSDQGFGSPGKGKSPTHLDVPAKGKGKNPQDETFDGNLVKGHSHNPQYSKAKGKGKQVFPFNSGGNSGKGKGVGKTGTAAQNQGGTPEGLLLEALKRLVGRSFKNQGHGLLERLTELVKAATQGKRLQPKRKREKKTVPKPGAPKGLSSQPVTLQNNVETRKGKGKGKSLNVGNNMHGPQTPRKFQPTRLLPNGWPPHAAMNVTRLRETLAKGEVPAGCVTWCTEDQICELRNLAEIHKITKAFALVCLAATGRQEPPHVQAVKHLLPAVNAAGQAGLGEFWAVPLSAQFPQLPSCSTCSRAPKVERTLVTLRVQVPQRLIQTDGWNNLVRSPAAILRSVIPPTDFHSTFKWAQVSHKTKYGGAEVVLEGYVKVDQACVFDLLRKSGSKGLFFSQIAKDNPNPLQVFWVPRVANESDCQYMARAQQIGLSKQTPLKFRIGGGACLGLIGVDAKDEKPKVWQISNVPSKWTAQDVVRCLEGAGCEDTTVVRRPSKRQPWIVLSRVQKQFQNVQVFGIESNGIHITLSKPPPKPSITGTQAVAAGAWKHKDTPSAPLANVGDTQIDSSQDEEQEAGAKKKHKSEAPAPYEIIDCGGAGNCGWNCIATALMLNKKVPLDQVKQQVPAATKTLRADVATHLLRHSQDYQPLWAVNDKETEVTAAGRVPQSFNDWVETVKRDGQWLCGLSMEAAAKRCDICIVVVEERQDGTTVPYVFGSNKKRTFPVILLLKNEHFQLIRKREGHAFPVEWEKSGNTNDAYRLQLRGAGRWWANSAPRTRRTVKTEDSNSQKLRFWPGQTPSAKNFSPRSQARTEVSRKSATTRVSPPLRLWGKTTPKTSGSVASNGTDTALGFSVIDETQSRVWTKATPAQTKDSNRGENQQLGPKLGTLIPVSVQEQLTRPWWTCQLCGFQVFVKRNQGKYSEAHGGARRKHLFKVHGFRTIPHLSRNDLVHSAVATAARKKHNLEIGWKAVWTAYNEAKWPGAHRIALQGRTIVRKAGFVVHRHTCIDCGQEMDRGDVPKRNPCACDPNAHNAPPKAERIKLWRSFQKLRNPAMREARKLRYQTAMNKKESANQASKFAAAKKKQLSSNKADGCSATRRNHRGERVGEASHPGPTRCLSSLGFWSLNIRSWNKHGAALLDEAATANVHIVCCQETNLYSCDFEVAVAAAHRQGWQLLCTPPVGKRRGGLAVAVREPLAAAQIQEVSNETGQVLQVEIHSSGAPFRLFNLYQLPGCWDPAISHPVAGLELTPWICCGDFNCNVEQLDLGQLVGTGRHSTSKHPIDAIWASHLFPETAGGEKPSFGSDHSLAWAVIKGSWTKSRGSSAVWTLRHCRRSPAPPLVLDQEIAQQAWTEVACNKEQWQEALLGDVETVWKQWTSDFQNFLVKTQQILPPKKGTLMGALPSLVSTGHHGAPGQGIKERMLRRGIRRVREAAVLARKGAPYPKGLIQNISKSLGPHHTTWVRNQQWSLAEAELLARLDDLIKTQTKVKQAEWAAKMSHLPEACKSVKHTNPPPFLLDSGEAGRIACLHKLHPFWKRSFGCDTLEGSDPQAFCQLYHEDLPETCPEYASSPLTLWDLRHAAVDMTRKATGPDGISAQNLLTMPNDGWERFTAMMCRFENLSQFPAAVTHWKVVFIPKGGTNDKLTVDKLRPLSVGSMVYRIWARCRVKQLSPLLEQHLAPLQANRKMDPEVLHLILLGECPPELYPYGLALDYKKAFDSLNCSLGLHLLQKVGVPTKILGLLASQWQRQTRWLSLGGAIHAEPLQNVPSLPQGDPWSPITLALVLSCPARRCARIFPAVRCTLYLDDRTMVSRDVNALKDALHDWEQLATVTRLCTNHAKTQFWVRTARVAARFPEDEAPFPIKQHVEVLGFHLGARPHEHPKRIARLAKGKQMALKIFRLPVPQSLKSQLAHTLLTSNAAWGQDVTNRGPFGEAHDQHLRNFKIAVFGPHSGSPDSDRAKQQGRASPHLRQLLDLGHGSDLAFVVTTRLLNSLARWLQARRPDNPLLETFKRHTNKLWSTVQSYLLKWGWRRLDWGRWGISRDILFAACMSKDQRDLAMHHLRQSWRKSLLQKWLESDRLDAAIAVQAGLNETIDDSLVDKIRKTYKQLNNPHEKAVFTGGMHTAGSTRWGGTAEKHDDQGNMCCPDCETNQYPSLCHVLWHCPFYERHRTIAKPVCPLACRLGWSHSTPATLSLRLVTQMGSIREAEVSRRMQRVRLLTAQDLRGGARTKSHCVNQDQLVPTKATVDFLTGSATCIPVCVPIFTKDTGLGEQDRDSCTKVQSTCHSKDRLVSTKDGDVGFLDPTCCCWFNGAHNAVSCGAAETCWDFGGSFHCCCFEPSRLNITSWVGPGVDEFPLQTRSKTWVDASLVLNVRMSTHPGNQKSHDKATFCLCRFVCHFAQREGPLEARKSLQDITVLRVISVQTCISDWNRIYSNPKSIKSLEMANVWYCFFLGNCNTVRAPRRPAKNFQRSRTAARLNQPPSFTLSEFVCEFVWLFTPFEFVFNFVCSIGYDYDCKVCSLPVSLDQYFFRFDVIFYRPLCWPPGARAVVAMVQVA